MAVDELVQCITLKAGADLSAKQYFVVDISSTSETIEVAGNAEDAIGILYNDPDAAGKAATVAIGGCPLAIAGGTIASGARLGVDAAGEVVTAASSDEIIGRALQSAVDGDIFRMKWEKNGLEA